MKPFVCTRLGAIAFATAALVAVPAYADDEDGHGKDVFAKCALCHQVGDDARNDVGPKLNGVYGAPAGSRSGFSYSRAMLDAGQQGLVWTDETLDRYLQDPRAFLTGGRMAFAGIPDPDDRAAVIDYLKSFR